MRNRTDPGYSIWKTFFIAVVDVEYLAAFNCILFSQEKRFIRLH